MKIRLTAKSAILTIFFIGFIYSTQAQFLVDLIDTNSTEEKGLWAIYRKTDHLQISGYFQPQFLIAQSKGTKTYAAGDFADNSNSRFMMRRARIRFDYAHFSQDGLPQAQVVFQFDGTERGVVIRDFWGRVYENRWQLFSFTTGMFARPFGYEVNMSSGDREAPERGRMSPVLMRTERDLGAMVTFEPRRSSKLKLLKFDIGVFNGQGLTATEEFDSYKDIIARLSLKRYQLLPNLSLTGGASILEGGLVQVTPQRYTLSDNGVTKNFVLDSSTSNIGAKAPRKYRGVDAQLRLKHGWGKSELRAEYWWGTQTGYAEESNTPSTPLDKPFFIRKFDGLFLYFLQDIVNEHNQLLFRYDFYDPNRKIGGETIGNPDLRFAAGDIRYHQFGLGYIHYFNDHLKFLAWYDFVRNEKTSLEGFEEDLKDNILTLRVQYEF